jgi:checkpoint serine/threonine-protein kinase
MNIEYAIIASNASVLISNFSPHGNILDVCNKVRNATRKNVDELIVMMLTSQILLIIDHLHACNIIHADVKPDNFLLMKK